MAGGYRAAGLALVIGLTGLTGLPAGANPKAGGAAGSAAAAVPAVPAVAPAVSAASAASAASPQRPFDSQFSVRRIEVRPDGSELAEDTPNMTIGDIAELTARHTNVSRRRLLDVDLGIAIPPGTRLIEGSASPGGARLAPLQPRGQQMLWRVPRIEPGATVVLRLRVRIEPDPSLLPAPAEPRRPELRRAPAAGG